MSNVIVRKLVGVEKDRAAIRAAALRIIRHIEDQPKLKHDDARKDWLAPPPLTAFRRMEPLGFGLNEGDDFWIFNPRECTPDIVWPLDVAMCCENAGSRETLALRRTYTVNPKQVRGYASRFGPFMVREDIAMMDRGKLLTCAGLLVWLGGKWCDAQNRVLWSGRDRDTAIPERGCADPSDTNQVRVATALALRHRYEWSVCLGLEHSPTVRFATDPTGIKDVFRIRDLPEGRDRRAALLTWVSDHWRQERHDPEIETYVRKHLRGAASFTWKEMDCEIVPAPFDIEQRDKLIGERQAMKIAGVDKRIRKA